MTAPTDPERLRRLFAAPGLEPLLRRVRERLARGIELSGTIRLRDLSPQQRDAVARLVGRAPVATDRRTTTVSLDDLNDQLRAAGVCASLHEAVELLYGPVADRNQQRARREAEWRCVFATARDRMSGTTELREWLDRLERSGRLKRLSGNDPEKASAYLDALARVVSRWPAPALPLAAFAAEVLGDAHALDASTEIGTLAVTAAAEFQRSALDPTAEGRRAAWAGVGILCDELSTPALVLNLAPAASTPLARMLREAAAAGEPMHVSLRSLLRFPLAADPSLAEIDVYVCENPSIVALAAARLGARSKPLVCGSGQPATPVQVLLRQLCAAGSRLHYHGDFDRGGLAIARWVMERFGARPWRMSAADYSSAASRGISLVDALSAERCSSPWDPDLAAAIAERGQAVHEELVADVLLADLERS